MTSITIYTDGACKGNPGHMGIGFIIHHPHRIVECTLVSTWTGIGTNNIAELGAIGGALDELEKDEHSRPIRLYTDSQYAIGVLTGVFKVNTNFKIIEAIKARITQLSDFQFVKVKGHAGDPLNCLADKLATTAAKSQKSSRRICALHEAVIG